MFLTFDLFSCVLCCLMDLLKWVGLFCSGDAQIGSNVTPLDPSTVASDVWYGKQSGKYTSKRGGNATVYSQLYPFKGLLNYTSGIIHHVKIDGKHSIVNFDIGKFMWH